MPTDPDWKTIIIAIILSIIVSTGIMNVPQLQDALRGPQGEPGPPGPPGPGLGELIHDSGWLPIAPMGSLQICTLDDANVFVYMIGRADDVDIYPLLDRVGPDPDFPSYEAHQMYYGGDRLEMFRPYLTYPDPGMLYPKAGACWYIDEYNRLKVSRHGGDFYYEEVRVLVWQLPS